MRTSILPPVVTDQATRDHRRAWWALATYPVVFVLTFAVGEGLASWYGYPAGGETTPPWWVLVGAAGPALLLFAVPGSFAWRHGRRAARAGVRAARVPMWLGLAIPVLFTLQNIVAYLVGG